MFVFALMDIIWTKLIKFMIVILVAQNVKLAKAQYFVYLVILIKIEFYMIINVCVKVVIMNLITNRGLAYNVLQPVKHA